MNLKHFGWKELFMLLMGSFPGLLKSFPVKSSEIRDVSPLEYALETVESSSMELKELISSIKSGIFIFAFLYLPVLISMTCVWSSTW